MTTDCWQHVNSIFVFALLQHFCSSFCFSSKAFWSHQFAEIVAMQEMSSACVSVAETPKDSIMSIKQVLEH